MKEQRKDPETGACSECKSEQPYKYTVKQLKMGFGQFPCKYCGGVAMVVRKDALAQFKKSSDKKRGLA